MPAMPQKPPEYVTFGLEEAIELLAALEDSRLMLVMTDHFAVHSQIEEQLQVLLHNLGLEL